MNSHSPRLGGLVVAVFAVGLGAFGPRAALAQEPPSTLDLLSHRAPIVTESGGILEVPLSAEVLTLAAPDLSDVRILDSDSALIPYVTRLREAPESATSDALESFDLALTNARQTQALVGGIRVSTEVYEVLVPLGAWREHAELEFETARTGFTAHVRVIGPDGLDLATGTLFSLPSIDAAQSTIELPARVAGLVRIELRSEPSTFGGAAAAPGAYLTPRIRMHQRSHEPHLPTVEQILERVGTPSTPGAQVLELARPAGITPIRLRIETTSPTFASDVRVEAVGTDGTRREIGRGRILRVTPSDPEAVFSALDVPITARSIVGDRLVVTLDRGDSPPLESVTVVAVVRQPTLVFAAYGWFEDGSLTLAFGGGRLRAPRYDVGFLENAASEATASLGPVTASPDYRRDVALGFAMRAGAEVDRTRFAVEAPLTIGEAPEGLTRVRMSPALAALARADSADVRVVGSDGRQWPFVLSRNPREVWVDLAVSTTGPAQDRPRTTRYVLTPSVELVTAEQIELTFSDSFYSRLVTVVGLERPDVADEPVHTLTEEYVESTSGSGPVLLSPGLMRARVLEVFVEDGDEAPLTLTAARARVSISDLLVTAPAGEYTVLAGDAALGAPEYDLSRADASLLDNVPALDVDVGTARPNPAYSRPSMFERAGWEAVVLYVALALAVLVLGLLTLRLARSEPAPGSPPASPGGSAPGMRVAATAAGSPAAAPPDTADDSEPSEAEGSDDSDE